MKAIGKRGYRYGALESKATRVIQNGRPTPATLRPVLAALPSTCAELDICYVLPAAQGSLAVVLNAALSLAALAS